MENSQEFYLIEMKILYIQSKNLKFNVQGFWGFGSKVVTKIQINVYGCWLVAPDGRVGFHRVCRPKVGLPKVAGII